MYTSKYVVHVLKKKGLFDMTTAHNGHRLNLQGDFGKTRKHFEFEIFLVIICCKLFFPQQF